MIVAKYQYFEKVFKIIWLDFENSEFQKNVSFAEIIEHIYMNI